MIGIDKNVVWKNSCVVIIKLCSDYVFGGKIVSANIFLSNHPVTVSL